MAEVHVRDSVYYTGDMANDSAWLTVRCTGPESIGMDAPDGRVFNIPPSHIGDVYKGHCNPRFVTKKAYNEYRERMGFPPRA